MIVLCLKHIFFLNWQNKIIYKRNLTLGSNVSDGLTVNWSVRCSSFVLKDIFIIDIYLIRSTICHKATLTHSAVFIEDECQK